MIVIILFVQLITMSYGMSIDYQIQPSGPNVCLYQVQVNKTVSISYLSSKRVLVDGEFQTVRETLTRPKVISKLENVTKCCEGYKLSPGGASCLPDCSQQPCKNGGTCDAPNFCKCQPGYLGPDCANHVPKDDPACPEGKWGQDCTEECLCQNRGKCDSKTGACDCYPGFQGDACEDQCDLDHFGLGCKNQCNCDEDGKVCHYITGECMTCTNDTYGRNCEQPCHCDKVGTDICHPSSGKCYCKDDFYGEYCEKHCPDGFDDTSDTCNSHERDKRDPLPGNDNEIPDVEVLSVPSPPTSLNEKIILKAFDEEIEATTEKKQYLALLLLLGLAALTVLALILIVFLYRRRIRTLKIGIMGWTAEAVQLKNEARQADESKIKYEI